MTEDSILLPHKLTLNERKSLTLNGVTEVVSFDDESVVLKTAMGILTVHGQGLQLKNLSLDGGQVAVDGSVAALIYEEPRPERSWLGRLFR
ncbi:MAG: sporulation protein YabP [Oscillospiraceae bacterium]|nr:sporulation protein YabP [Oscillospiraceae bacterium]